MTQEEKIKQETIVEVIDWLYKNHRYYLTNGFRFSQMLYNLAKHILGEKKTLSIMENSKCFDCDCNIDNTCLQPNTNECPYYDNGEKMMQLQKSLP